MGILVFALLLFAVAFFLFKTALGPVKFSYKTFFLSGYVNHNNITRIKRGACLLKFESGKFYIIQDDEKIEDNSSDIYGFRVWTFKNGLYLAIRTKTHSEYKFSLVNPDVENSDMAYSVPIKLLEALAKRLKVEFSDCGESVERESIEE